MKLIFFVIISVLIFGGCDTTLERCLISNVAEVSEFVVSGREDGVFASLMCGMRESDYKMNGYATTLIPFGIITINLGDMDSLNVDKANFVLFVGTEKFNGELEKNPYDETFVADIGKIVDKDKNIKLDMLLGDWFKTIELVKVDQGWSVDTRDCLKILIDNYNQEVKSFIQDDVFEGEVYVKIKDDYDMYSSDYFYYVSVIGRRGNYINMLISCYTGEILASNINVIE